ncbi:MAG: EF-hand domain-containing protein [Kiritimatiellaceae bacterium]|nr:EF-hand domain-containing protein [Kiritimatiellaceae bacterium]
MRKILCGTLVMMTLCVFQAFGSADVNHDGLVSREECYAARTKLAQKAGKEFDQKAAEAFFNATDTNGDGFLSQEELAKPVKTK